jgi:hypothetical protein
MDRRTLLNFEGDSRNRPASHPRHLAPHGRCILHGGRRHALDQDG